jgi:hypothetical protein
VTKKALRLVGGQFVSDAVYAEVEGQPDDRSKFNAMDELDYFTDHILADGRVPRCATSKAKS